MILIILFRMLKLGDLENVRHIKQQKLKAPFPDKKKKEEKEGFVLRTSSPVTVNIIEANVHDI